MRIRSIMAAAVIAGLVLPAAPAMAASKIVVVKDPVGDANSINDQGLAGEFCLTNDPDICSPVPIPAFGDIGTAPVTSSGLDIVSISWQTQFVTKRQGRRKIQVPTNMIVAMTLAGTPTSTTVAFRASMTTPGDCNVLLVEWQRYPSGTEVSELRSCDPEDSTFLLGTAIAQPKVNGNRITWTVPLSVLAKLPFPIKTGAALTNLGGTTQAAIGDPECCALFLPVVDTMTSSSKYTLGK
jgi:hypothetical protein